MPRPTPGEAERLALTCNEACQCLRMSALVDSAMNAQEDGRTPHGVRRDARQKDHFIFLTLSKSTSPLGEGGSDGVGVGGEGVGGGMGGGRAVPLCMNNECSRGPSNIH